MVVSSRFWAERRLLDGSEVPFEFRFGLGESPSPSWWSTRHPLLESSPLPRATERVTWRSLLEEAAAVRPPEGDSGRRMARPSPSTPPISLEWAARQSWRCAQLPVDDNRLCPAGGRTRPNCL